MDVQAGEEEMSYAKFRGMKNHTDIAWDICTASKGFLSCYILPTESNV